MKTFTKAKAQGPTIRALLVLLALAAVNMACSGVLHGQEKYKANVSVEMDQARTFVAVRAWGIHTSIDDGGLMDPQVALMLRQAGVTTLRYPGGKFADNYHFSTNKLTRWQAEEPPKYDYYNPGNDFGHFVKLLDQIPATAIITVNYGSNLAGTGGGEPAEAAAWVAYANGDPSDTRVIGKDSTGYDWNTVGHWASLRAAEPLPQDDGMNFLRIAHPKPVNIAYWEIGNEVYGNGWYEKDNSGSAEDLHAPYGGKRAKNPALSPQAYGKNVVAFVKAMKAVDSRIKIGAVLTRPVSANAPESDWNPGVLKEAGPVIDFAIIHWSASGDMAWNGHETVVTEDTVPSLLRKPETELPDMIFGAGQAQRDQWSSPTVTVGLLDQFKKYCGANAQNMQIAVTEFGVGGWPPLKDEMARALFVGDGYLSWIEAGAANIDYRDLRNKFLGDKNAPEPPYYAVQVARRIFRPNDTVVSSKSSRESLAAHAVKRADGNLGLVLINKDPQKEATVKIAVKGSSLSAKGARVDYGKGVTPTGAALPISQVEGLGNTFEVSVPAYTITGIVVVKAQ